MKHAVSPPSRADSDIVRTFAGILVLVEQDPALIARGGPSIFKGDLYFYRADGDLRGRVGMVDTKVCPPHLHPASVIFPAPQDTKRTAAAIGGARVTIMEQLGHFPMSENPEQFRRHIAPVLGEVLKQSMSTKQGENV